MPKVTIADVLHYAADECLWEGEIILGLTNKRYFSCGAIIDALVSLKCWHHLNSIEEALVVLGLNIESTSAFSEFDTAIESQCARYNWLKFVALLAEEQGV